MSFPVGGSGFGFGGESDPAPRRRGRGPGLGEAQGQMQEIIQQQSGDNGEQANGQPAGVSSTGGRYRMESDIFGLGSNKNDASPNQSERENSDNGAGGEGEGEAEGDGENQRASPPPAGIGSFANQQPGLRLHNEEDQPTFTAGKPSSTTTFVRNTREAGGNPLTGFGYEQIQPKTQKRFYMDSKPTNLW